MAKIDYIAIIVFSLGLAMAMGAFLGETYGYNRGYQDGFNKALPLTYASVYKN